MIEEEETDKRLKRNKWNGMQSMFKSFELKFRTFELKF